ncbi:MAG: tungstate transporter permease, partial [Acidimicrobiia bacterium]
METLGRAFTDALELLWNMDSRLLEIVGLTLEVTLVALAIALLLGIPTGAAIGLARRLPGRAFLITLIYTGMGLP